MLQTGSGGSAASDFETTTSGVAGFGSGLGFGSNLLAAAKLLKRYVLRSSLLSRPSEAGLRPVPKMCSLVLTVGTEDMEFPILLGTSFELSSSSSSSSSSSMYNTFSESKSSADWKSESPPKRKDDFLNISVGKNGLLVIKDGVDLLSVVVDVKELDRGSCLISILTGVITLRMAGLRSFDGD